MSDPALQAPPLSREEMVRFAQLNQQFMDKVRGVVSRHRSALQLSKDANIPYSWVLDFLNQTGASYDMGRVCALYLACIAPDLEG
jgi:hypothetical protein